MAKRTYSRAAACFPGPWTSGGQDWPALGTSPGLVGTSNAVCTIQQDIMRKTASRRASGKAPLFAVMHYEKLESMTSSTDEHHERPSAAVNLFFGHISACASLLPFVCCLYRPCLSMAALSGSCGCLPAIHGHKYKGPMQYAVACALHGRTSRTCARFCIACSASASDFELQRAVLQVCQGVWAAATAAAGRHYPALALPQEPTAALHPCVILQDSQTSLVWHAH